MAALAVVVFATTAAAQTAGSGRLQPTWRDWRRLPPVGGRDLAAAEQHRQAEVHRRWHAVHEIVGPGHVSTRGRAELVRRGLGPALVDKSAATTGATWDGIDTLRVLIIRIAFTENRNPDLTTVEPGGDFQLTPLPDRSDTLYIDPPPHDRAYLEAHLQGLSEFYRYQSGGRLHIQGQVLPRGEQDSYRLTDIADYGPGAGNYWTLEKLEQFVRDAIVAADEGTQADGGPMLADYDDDNPLTYIIFVHAGSDWQSDINSDSPNDIPTFFVTLGEPQDLTSIDSETGEPGRLSECSVIPETTNQDGYAGSIAAAFYHEFGHALGLPDVYSTATALPQVGVWDLMDSGTNLAVTLAYKNADGDTIASIATGVLPPSLSAWNKWYLGWLETADINGGGYNLPAVQVLREQYGFYRQIGNFDLDDPQAVRGGMSPREWFLIENRWVPGSSSDTPWDDLFFERDDGPDSTGVILYLAGERDGVAENSGLYDYYLPAGGLLVWHVNMDRIQEGLLDNTVNYYGDGLRLVEADGIQDIGVLNAYVRGWTGSALDPFGGYWYEYPGGVPTIQYNGFRTLAADGVPNTRCYDRSWSGLSLKNVKNLGQSPSVLTFATNLEPLLSRFPWQAAPVDSVTPRGVDVNSLTTVTVDDEPVLIYADAAPRDWTGEPWSTGLYSLRPTGVARWPGPDIDRLGMFLALTEPVVGLQGGPLAGPPTGWTAADGTGRLLIATAGGELAFFTLAGSSVRDPQWTAAVGDTLLGTPLVLRDADAPTAVVCPVGPDRIVVLDPADGTTLVPDLELGGVGLGPVSFAGALRLLPVAAGGDEFVAATDGGWIRCRLDNGLVAASWVTWPREAVGPIRSAYVDGPDSDVLGFYDDEGLLGTWYPDGLAAGMDWETEAALVTEPAVADLNGDGRDDVILATARRIFAYQVDGVPVRGFPRPLRDLFPLPDTTNIGGPLVVADADGDGANELLFSTDGGHLFSLDAGGDLRGRTPLRWGDGAAAGFAVMDAAAADGRRVLWMASPGGTTTWPLARRINNGRVLAFSLDPAADAAERTSEWRGAAGGSDRRGPAGIARHLGAAGPLAAEFDQAIVYPNPLREDNLTVRFYSAGENPARFAIHDLEGEKVVEAAIPVTGNAVNEHRVPLAGLASGMYVCWLQWDAPGGRRIRTMTLAVEK